VKTVNSTVNDNINKIAKKVNKGWEVLHEMKTWYKTIDGNQLNFNILSAVHDTEAYLIEVDTKYKNLVSALHQTAHLFDFITPYNLKELVKSTQNKLSSTIQIVSTPSTDLEIDIANFGVKICGFLHLMETTVFKLSHITAIPTKVAPETFTAITRDDQFLAINTQEYFSISKQELKECNKVKQNTFLCSPVNNKQH
jgi:hypothetical protein